MLARIICWLAKAMNRPVIGIDVVGDFLAELGGGIVLCRNLSGWMCDLNLVGPALNAGHGPAVGRSSASPRPRATAGHAIWHGDARGWLDVWAEIRLWHERDRRFRPAIGHRALRRTCNHEGQLLLGPIIEAISYFISADAAVAVAIVVADVLLDSGNRI